LYLIKQRPETVSEFESWWDGMSTSVADYSVYGDESASDVVAPESAVRVQGGEETKDGYSEHGKIYYKNETHLTKGMPYWVGKYPFMPAAEKIDDEDRICYVHVGKTAGSSMACSLGFSYDSCPIDRIHLPHGNLPKFTTSMVHKQFNDCKTRKIALYLFIVRDPLSRMQSWFTYERPPPNQTKIWNPTSYARKELLFVKCPFPTLNVLGGELGLGANNVTLCSRRAWKAITGEEAYSAHNYYNFAFYYNEVMQQDKDARIVVLRTEHLEQDWRTIETQILHGPQPFDSNFTFPTKHSSHKNPEDYILSPESQENICHALCAEIQVYKYILSQAENLDKTDYDVSMQELMRHCPVEAALKKCN
jgi:Sulfotransferase family